MLRIYRQKNVIKPACRLKIALDRRKLSHVPVSSSEIVVEFPKR